MKRRLLALAFAGTLLAALAGPVTADSATVTGLSTSGSVPGLDCPSIVEGDGAYLFHKFEPEGIFFATPHVSWFFVLSAPSCRSSAYTLSFLPTDAAGKVLSNRPAISERWRGDGVTTQFSVDAYLPATGYPAGLCVYATSQIGANVIHYAPSGDPATTCVWLELDPSSSGGQSFRG